MRPERDTEERRSVQLAKLVPNMFTLLGLCAGLSSIRWSLDGRWELAVSLIIIAAIIDAMDGRLARMLNTTSTFGAQLDSLADFINFGVAPAFILYKWQLHEIKGIGWAIVLFFAVCAAIRLARFNTDLESDEPKPDWEGKFFVGMPSPAGALTALGPLVFTLGLREEFPAIYQKFSFYVNTEFICAYVIGVALFMASRIPTFSFKKISIKKQNASFILALAGIFVISLLTLPWVTIFATGIVYWSTLPFGILSHYRYSRQENRP